MSNLYAGIHIADMTPQTGGIPLSGWGATHLRLAATVGDPIMCNVLALGNGKKAEILAVNLDLINIDVDNLNRFRAVISKKTGVPQTNIIISGTHTHSAPDITSPLDTIKTYLEYCDKVIPDCALRAIEDMKPAKVFYGKNEVGKPGMRLNFVRHYTMTDASFKDHPEDGPVYYSGNNFGFQYTMEPDKYIYTGHETEADPELLLIELKRENADTIMLVNFQSHALISSGVACTVLTSDFPGALCKTLMEEIPNTKAVYIQGCCGNINPCTRIREEAMLGINFDPFTANDDTDNDYRAYGMILAKYAKEIHYNKLTESKTDDLKFAKATVNAKYDHSKDHMVDKIMPCIEKFRKEGNTREVIAFAMSLGLNSPYTATGILNRSKKPESVDVEVNALRIGDTAMVTAPFELYDQIGRTVKADSPFPCTFMQCYSCGRNAYLPAKGTISTSYERDNTSFVPGTAEQIGDAQLELLEKLK